MNLESDKRLNIQLRLDFSSAPTGEARQAGREDIESHSVANEPERPANTSRIMEEVCERTNLKEALRQVRGNKGSAGVDRMTVDQLGDYLKQHWPAIREQLLNGTYEPKPVRRVEIPKPDGGGVRKLGIPTVLDRFIQQAVMQVLQRRWNPTFSLYSYGFRPRRSILRATPAPPDRTETWPACIIKNEIALTRSLMAVLEQQTPNPEVARLNDPRSDTANKDCCGIAVPRSLVEAVLLA